MLGFGIPTCIVAASSLLGELGYPKERPILTSLFNVSYFIGELTSAGICFATNTIDSDWSWRLPSVLQAVPSLIQISLVLFLPESPRWLISKDRHEEANEILVTYHAEGDHDSEFVRAEMAQIRSTLALEFEASKKSWMDLLATSGMRRRVVISTALGLFTQWSGNTLLSYYLGSILTMIGWTNSTDKQKVNVGLSAWSLITAATAAMLVTKFRRRVMYQVCAISLLCVYIGWTVAMERSMTAEANGGENKSAGIAVLFFIFAYKPCYNIG
jgi:MFS family permease